MWISKIKIPLFTNFNNLFYFLRFFIKNILIGILIYWKHKLKNPTKENLFLFFLIYLIFLIFFPIFLLRTTIIDRNWAGVLYFWIKIEVHVDASNRTVCRHTVLVFPDLQIKLNFDLCKQLITLFTVHSAVWWYNSTSLAADSTINF